MCERERGEGRGGVRLRLHTEGEGSGGRVVRVWVVGAILYVGKKGSIRKASVAGSPFGCCGEGVRARRARTPHLQGEGSGVDGGAQVHVAHAAVHAGQGRELTAAQGGTGTGIEWDRE